MYAATAPITIAVPSAEGLVLDPVVLESYSGLLTDCLWKDKRQRNNHHIGVVGTHPFELTNPDEVTDEYHEHSKNGKGNRKISA